MSKKIFKDWLDENKKHDPLLFESIKVVFDHFFESTEDVVADIEQTLGSAEKFTEAPIEEGFSDPDESELDDVIDDESDLDELSDLDSINDLLD